MEIWYQTKFDDWFTFYQKFCQYLTIPPSAFADLHPVTAPSCSGELLEATTQSLLGLRCIADRGCESYQPKLLDFVGFCVCVCVYTLPVCVQSPLESINPKSNRLTAEAAFDVCWIPLWNIGCCFNNIQFLFPPQESIVLFSRRQTHTHLWCQDCPAGQVAAVLWVCLHLQVCFYQFFVL